MTVSQLPETLSPLPSGLTPPPPAGPPGYSWSQSWIKALTQPSVTTFEQIASDAAASSNSRAYNWLFIAGIIAGVINFLGGFIFPKTLPFPGADSRIVQGSPSLLSLLCGVPIAVLIGILILVVRSEEHTSELQSRQYLVCRLLLEKKKPRHILRQYV